MMPECFVLLERLNFVVKPDDSDSQISETDEKNPLFEQIKQEYILKLAVQEGYHFEKI